MNTVSKIAPLLIVMLAPALAQSGDWKYGIGTGLYGLNVNGDGGFYAKPIAQTIVFDASMDSDEVREYTQSAFGFGGFAKKDRWTINYAAGRMELGDDLSGMSPGGNVNVDIAFTVKSAQLSANYDFYQGSRQTVGVLLGAVYSSHEYDVDVTGAAVFSDDLDDEWTDFILGFTHSWAFTPRALWSSRVDAGTEGRVYVETGVTWLINKNWSTRAYVSSNSYDHENGDPGDSDYYLYDAREYGAGVSFAYLF